MSRLARLELDEATIERLGGELGSMLGSFERLRELDLSGVDPMAHPLDARNRLDEDVARPPLANEVLMGMAPESAPPYLKVPRVLPGQSGA